MKKLTLYILAADLFLFGAIVGGLLMQHHLSVPDKVLMEAEDKAYGMGALDFLFEVGPRSGVPFDQLCGLKADLDSDNPPRFLRPNVTIETHDQNMSDLDAMCKGLKYETKPNSSVAPSSSVIRPRNTETPHSNHSI